MFKQLLQQVACSVHRDENGTGWRVPAARAVKTKGGKTYEGCQAVEVWWDRDVTNKSDENIILRQERGGGEPADVIQITLGQAYDLLHALGWAIKTP